MSPVLAKCAVWAGWIAAFAGAALAADPAPAPAAFRLFSQPYQIPERGTVPSYTVLTESNRFNFIPPSGWVAKVAEAERRVTLQPPTLAAGLIIRWLDLRTNSIPKEQTNFWQGFVAERFPDGAIVHEFGAYSRAGVGLGFDLERRAEGASTLSTRVVYVPYENGTVELSLTTPAHQLSEYHHAFGATLSSFNAEPWSPPPPEPGRQNP